MVGQWMALRGVPVGDGQWSGVAIMMSLAFALILALYAKGCIEYLIRIRFDAAEIYWFWKRHVWN